MGALEKRNVFRFEDQLRKAKELAQTEEAQEAEERARITNANPYLAAIQMREEEVSETDASSSVEERVKALVSDRIF